MTGRDRAATEPGSGAGGIIATFRLGLRLALGDARDGRVRLAMMTGGIAIAVALLLCVTGVLPALAERIDKTAGRGVEPAATGAHTDGVRARLSVGHWRGHQVRTLLVEVVGPPVAPPAGVPRTPGPGEVFVSPGLAHALAGAHGAELAPRLPDRVVGTVGRAGLVGPDELYAVAGAAPGDLDDAVLAPSFARPESGSLFGSEGAYVDGTGSRQEAGPVDELLVVVGLAGVGLVVPLLVLVGTSTRLSAASRERRASAMRLVGATARQLRMFGGVEAGVVGVAGAALGAALFLVLRGPAVALLPITDGLYADDVAPPPIAGLVVLVGVPVLTALTGTLALRRAVASPLGVRRQAAAPRAGAELLLPLAAGLAMVAGAYASRAVMPSAGWPGRVLLLGGAALCLVGLAVGTPALSRAAGTLLSRRGRSLAGQLAGRRLVADPAGSARALSGAALVVVLLGWVVALLPVLAVPPGGTGGAGLVEALRPNTMVVTLDADAEIDSVVPKLGAVPGVSAVAAVRHTRMLPPGVRLPDSYSAHGRPEIGEQPVRAIVADCAQLGQVFRVPLAACRPGTVQHLSTSWFDTDAIAAAGRLQPLDEHGDPLPGPALDLPPQLSSVTLPEALTERNDGLLLGGDLLVPPASAPATLQESWFPNLLVGTDGRAATLEAVRAELGLLRTPTPPQTAEEMIALARSADDGYARAALGVVLAVVVVGGLSLAITTADGIRERQRAHSALTAMGTPVRVLRHSVLLHTAPPLLLTIGLAVLVTAATSWLYLRLGPTSPSAPPPPSLPWAAYGAIGVTTLVACLLASAAAMPFVRSSTRPDALRTE